ncbi:permease [Kitasatospora viridis]|uniref:Permease n=1 Tax=Kitasatospora viridis TaxID=281105 RepID=A0A561UPT0_9ACTN|nr:permease [Kitasatospora viridis]TWG01341.1 hypothetical protein FHX73_115233 [Kitasatospora viridis]
MTEQSLHTTTGTTSTSTTATGRDPASGTDPPGDRAAGPSAARRIGSLELLVAGLVLLLVARPWLAEWFAVPGFQAWATVFVAICVQALPFLVLGTLLSAVITALVPASFLRRALPRRTALAVPVAGLAGAVLPGCECASVPVADGLIAGGVAPAAALAFLLSAPAINPVVLTATAVAFPGRPEMVLARFAASLVTAVLIGWLWARLGQPEWLRPSARRERAAGEDRWTAFRGAFTHEFLHAAGFLVIGGITSATLNVVVPRGWLGSLAHLPVLPVLVLAVLAVVLAVCSEADAFVAASLGTFPLAARLAFMVVGPMVDVKLVAMQAGTFGWSFAWRFSAATFTVAVAASALIGWWLL